MSSCREKVDATVDSAVRDWPLAIYIKLFFQVLLILLVDILHNGLPATDRQTGVRETTESLSPQVLTDTYQSLLLIWSPNPGVSTTVSFILTPFSSMTVHRGYTDITVRDAEIKEMHYYTV